MKQMNKIYKKLLANPFSLTEGERRQVIKAKSQSPLLTLIAIRASEAKSERERKELLCFCRRIKLAWEKAEEKSLEIH